MTYILGIYNSKNKRFRKDGDEFKREAKAWFKAQMDGWEYVPTGSGLADVTDGRVRAEIRKMTAGLDVLAIFDHGTPKGLPRMRENLGNVKGLAATIAGVTDKITIILYACSCGRGWWGRFGFRWMNMINKHNMYTSPDAYSPRDGYAIALCCELAKLGVEAEAWAHLTKGHTTQNPHIVRIHKPAFIGEADSETRTVYRERMSVLGTPEWEHWKRDLKGPLRFTFWH